MNTVPKNIKPDQGLSLHPEQLSTDNNPRKLYEVTVRDVTFRETRVRVKAKSETAAETAAVKRACHADWKWEEYEHDLYAFSVEQVKEGGSHA
jgi:hypothetical protein